ncbi:MAG: AMP-binding protein [Pseudomonadota bacterium]
MSAHEDVSRDPWLSIYAALKIPTATLPPTPSSLADRVALHAGKHPSHPAMEYLGVTLSYGELDLWANRMAAVLREHGIIRGDVIGVHLPNTPQYLIALVAAAKLGAVISGVSPLLTAGEMAHQINDAGIKLLLTLDQLYNPAVAPMAGQVPGLHTVLITGPIDFLPRWKQGLAKLLKKLPVVTPKAMAGVRVAALQPLLRRAPTTPIHCALKDDDVIYIQYTGGTTGKPKGAVQTLASIFSSLHQLNTVQGYVEGEETIASAFPYFHMAGLSLAIVGLHTGSRLLVIPDPRNVDMLCQVMRQYPPTFIANVPTLYQMLMENPSFASVDFSRLKMAVSGAAPFSPEQIHRLETFIGQGKLCEGFGMTETSGVTTINPPGHARIGSIGIPLPSTRAKIVDAETGTQELPAGEPGELIFRGGQIMACYLGNPESTAKTIRDFAGEPWLYSGDIATMDADGYITIVDRAKDMLIVGGYKVFSVEVETKLAELPCVAMSAVIGQPDQKRPGNDLVHLYVQLHADHKQREVSAVTAEILAFCRANMAAYKIPKEVHVLEALPLTAVGKLDKKVLRAQLQ